MNKHINYKDSFIENEIWLAVNGYERLYEISNLGRVKSLPKKKGRFVNKSTYILNQKNHRDGYLCVSLSKNKKMKCFQVHRLVAIAFHENPNELREVNHKDLNKQNNNESNLEWITSKGNKAHALKNGKMGLQKITWEVAREIRKLRAEGKKIRELVELFPLRKSAIGAIIYNKTWVENGYH